MAKPVEIHWLIMWIRQQLGVASVEEQFSLSTNNTDD